jgi:hypothetical protein
VEVADARREFGMGETRGFPSVSEGRAVEGAELSVDVGGRHEERLPPPFLGRKKYFLDSGEGDPIR